MSPGQDAQWFASQPPHVQSYFMIRLANEMIIALRALSTEVGSDDMLAAYRAITEIQHRLLNFVGDTMIGQETFPPSTIAELVLDQLAHSSLRSYGATAWNRNVLACESHRVKLKAPQ